MARGDNHTKAKTQAIRAINARLPQTQSAGKKSVSKFGYFTSRQASDDPGAIIRAGMSYKARCPAKVTLAPMPWDKETS